MYNGIGLKTARGSGTNGYIQRNLAHLPRPRQEYLIGLKRRQLHPSKKVAKPNKLKTDPSMTEYTKKRKIELLVFEKQCKLETEGNLSAVEIEEYSNKMRMELFQEMDASTNETTEDNHRLSFVNINVNDIMNQTKNTYDSFFVQKLKNLSPFLITVAFSSHIIISDSNSYVQHYRTVKKQTQNEALLNALGLRENDDGSFTDVKEEERKKRREEFKLRTEKLHAMQKRREEQQKRRRDEESDSSSESSSDGNSDDSTSDSGTNSSSESDKNKNRKRKRNRNRKSISNNSSNDSDSDHRKSRRYHRNRRKKYSDFRSRSRSRSRGRWGDDIQHHTKSKADSLEKEKTNIISDF